MRSSLAIKRSKPWAGAVLIGLALLCFGRAGWIEAKATIAQFLLEQAWDEALAGADQPRPWPHADTWPVARLRAPQLDRDLIVLAGASGRSLAFGPGHLTGSALPGEDTGDSNRAGNVVIAGHRDTHFAFLEGVEVGDRFEVEDPEGGVRWYEVRWTRVVDQSDLTVAQPTAVDALTLITCWPFRATLPGGPMRFVVRAEALAL